MLMQGDPQALTALVEQLGFAWKKPELLTTALTHTSYANERKQKLEHNQRLEFLGDAVLELVVSDYLYTHYPDYPEGVLTKVRAASVCEPSLAAVAKKLNLGKCLAMGKGEEKSGGRERPAALADAFEALAGAIYLDQGLEQARAFILQQLQATIDYYAAQGGQHGDFKSELQEWIQQYTQQELHYTLLKEEGPDHNKVFTAGVSIGGQVWGVGQGKTKKEAEQEAAHEALIKLRDQGAWKGLKK